VYTELANGNTFGFKEEWELAEELHNNQGQNCFVGVSDINFIVPSPNIIPPPNEFADVVLMDGPSVVEGNMAVLHDTDR
jgi:hypothetical protein